MRFRFFLLIAIILCFSYSSLAKESVRIAVQSSDSPPYQWHDKDGVLQGLTPDIYRQIFSELDYDVEFISVDFFDAAQWQSMNDRLNAGEIDFAGPIMLPPGGIQGLAVSKTPMLTIEMGFYFLKDKAFPIESIASLANYKGAAVGAGMPVPGGEEQEADPNFHVTFKSTAAEVEVLLRSGEARYWLTPTYVANGYIYSRELRGDFVASDFKMNLQYFLLSAPTASKQSMLNSLDKIIAEKYESGNIQRLMTYHLKRYVRSYEDGLLSQ